jgi:hypothetical protein
LSADKLRGVLNIGGDQMLIDTHRKWFEETPNAEDAQRQDYCTDSLVVGSGDYVRQVQEARHQSP